MYKRASSFFLTMLSMFLVGTSPAIATEPTPAPATVLHYTEAPARKLPNGMAVVYPIATQEQGAKNAFFGVLRLEAGAKIPPHRDLTEEYLYIIEGTGTITIDGLSYDLSPGHGVFMPAQAEVSFVAADTVLVAQFFAEQGPEAKYNGWQAIE